MVRRIRVFAVLLFASCLFCFSVRAEWSTSDGITLRDISLNTGLIETWCESISNNLIGYLDPSRATSFTYQNLQKLNSLLSNFSSANASLNNILSAINALRTDEAGNYFLTEFVNNTKYMTAWSTGNSGTNAGYIFPNTSASAAYNGLQGLTLLPGTYRITVLASYAWDFASRHYEAGTTSVIRTFDEPQVLQFNFYGAGYYYISIVQASGSDEAQSVSDLIGGSINSHNSDLSNNVDQLDGLEDQVFQGLDTSLGGLDFSGSALAQVVSGFTFIRAVFSAVYTSSPYISVLINLSCMLGVLALFLRVQPRFSRWGRSRHD